MKVYLVTRTPFPNGMAPANRIKCYAKAIKSTGTDVEVIIYQRTEKYGVKPKNTVGKGIFEGIPFRYIGGTPLRHRNALIRRFNDWCDKKNMLSFLRNNLKSDDVVLGYIGQDIEYTLSIIDTVHKSHAIFVRDLCELPYGTGTETAETKRNRERVIKEQAPICDGYICISQALKDFISPYTNNKAKNIIVPILVDYKQYELPDLSSEADFPYIFHAGSLTEQKDGVLGMLEAFGMASKKLSPAIKFVLTGNLAKAKAADRIKAILEKYDITNRVVFTGYLSDEELKDYLSRASLVIINKYVTQQNQYCFSTKLGEYLAAGKPVIITNIGEAINWLKNGVTAYIVNPEDRNELAQTIIRAFSVVTERQQIGQTGRELCKQSFDYLNWGQTLIEYFNKIQQSR